jgi:S-adenosylmethionine hydrolase
MKHLLICLIVFLAGAVRSQSHILVFQSDFGLKDGAVAAMKGVSLSVSDDLKIYDLTHDIPAFNIWEAAYRLNQTAAYWPAGTVFVSVVDPGVGSERRSIVMKSKSGHYFVTPDNGTLTLVAETLGVEEVRVINEAINRLQNTAASYTFHGRDVYAYTGAKLAAGVITFAQVGNVADGNMVRIEYQRPSVKGESIEGTIEILDIQYGNLWTNIDARSIAGIGLSYGEQVEVAIFGKDQLVFKDTLYFGRTFAEVGAGIPVAYLNSLNKFSIALNMGNFAERFRIQSGPEWKILIRRSR